MIRRHGVPATLLHTGRVVHTWLPGQADQLAGWRRWWEVYRRFRRQHGHRVALRLTGAAWRHGVTLSGPAEHIGGAS